MTSLHSETINVGRLFGQEFFFSIPIYQRPFSWDAEELSDLVDDLLEAPKGSDYFLGTLVLHETDGGVYDVVDGQQRLTALSILLACLRDLLGRDEREIQSLLVQEAKKYQGIPAKPRISVRDSAPYEEIVCTEGGTEIPSPLDSTASNIQRRYVLAVGEFRRALEGKTPAELQALVEFILRRVVVIYLAAPTFDDAFQLFTVVNDRGKQLRRIDVLKSVNLNPSVIPDPATRDEYARKWEDLEEDLNEVDFESIFTLLRLIYVQDKPEGDLLHEFQKRVYGKPGKPARGTAFINELADYVGLYEALFVTRDYLVDTADHALFKTLMFSMDIEFKASEWRACVLQYAKKFKQVGLLKFLLAIEKLYMSQWVAGVRKDERYGSYTKILKGIDANKTGATVIANVQGDDTAIRQACLIPSFYTASYAKYLLTRAEVAKADLTEPRQFAGRSIEHVLPQAPKPGSEWRNNFTDAEREELVHTAGNLVLLSKGKNSSAQNKEFADKKLTYLQPRVSEYPRSLQVLTEPSWLPAVVRKRTVEFADLAVAELG